MGRYGAGSDSLIVLTWIWPWNLCLHERSCRNDSEKLRHTVTYGYAGIDTWVVSTVKTPSTHSLGLSITQGGGGDCIAQTFAQEGNVHGGLSTNLGCGSYLDQRLDPSSATHWPCGQRILYGDT